MRPTKLSPTIHRTIVNAVGAGMSRTSAAALAGVGASTVRDWVKRGESRRKRDAAYARFAVAVAKASAKAELADLTTIKTAADKGDWRAAAWRLKHLRPEVYDERKRGKSAPIAEVPAVTAPPERQKGATGAPVVRLYPVRNA